MPDNRNTCARIGTVLLYINAITIGIVTPIARKTLWYKPIIVKLTRPEKNTKLSTAMSNRVSNRQKANVKHMILDCPLISFALA